MEVSQIYSVQNDVDDDYYMMHYSCMCVKKCQGRTFHYPINRFIHEAEIDLFFKDNHTDYFMEFTHYSHTENEDGLKIFEDVDYKELCWDMERNPHVLEDLINWQLKKLGV